MSDLIDRQAALEAIRNCTDIFVNNLPTMIDKVDAQEALMALPSAQPEIIWCKDCKYWDTTWQNDWAPNYHYCPMIDGTRRDDFYCADAERRTDE